MTDSPSDVQDGLSEPNVTSDLGSQQTHGNSRYIYKCHSKKLPCTSLDIDNPQRICPFFKEIKSGRCTFAHFKRESHTICLARPWVKSTFCFFFFSLGLVEGQQLRLGTIIRENILGIPHNLFQLTPRQIRLSQHQDPISLFQLAADQKLCGQNSRQWLCFNVKSEPCHST